MAYDTMRPIELLYDPKASVFLDNPSNGSGQAITAEKMVMVSQKELSLLLDWDIPLLHDLKKDEEKLFQFFSYANYTRPSECFFKRKLHKDQDGNIFLPSEAVEKRQFTTYPGIVVHHSTLVSEDADANWAMKSIAVGDVIIFIPVRSPLQFNAVARNKMVNSRGTIINRPDDIYMIHMGDIDMIFKIEENYQ